MTENKRYFKREWEEEYYIFDSKEISEEKVDEEIEYGYEIFADSMQGDEVVNKLNEQEEKIQRLKKENHGLQFKIIDMLDFVKEKGTVTREEIKKWWNGDVE